jgi:hypothetical protein
VPSCGLYYLESALRKSIQAGTEGLPLMSTRDKRSSYLAIRSCFSSLRVSYALSQRERSVAKSSVMSAAWPPVSLWDISTTVLALGLFGEVCNTVSDVVEDTAAGSEAKASVVNCWMGGTAVIDGAACSGGRRMTFARARKRRVQRCSIPCDNIADEAIAPYWGEPSCVFDLAESLPRTAGASAANRRLRVRGAAIRCASKGKASTIDVGNEWHNYKMGLFTDHTLVMTTEGSL